MRARRQQHDIGLAQAQPRPWRIAGVGRVHDEVVLRFAFVEPARAMVPGALLPHDLHAAKSRKSVNQPAGVRLQVEPRIERDQGDRARNDFVRVLAFAVHEAIHAQAGEPQDRFRMAEQDALKRRRRQHRELGVAQCPHRRSARPRDDDAHLADGLAGRDSPDELAARAVHAKAAAHHEVDRVRGAARLEQRPTARQRQPLETR